MILNGSDPIKTMLIFLAIFQLILIGVIYGLRIIKSIKNENTNN